MKPKFSILPVFIALTASAGLTMAADLTWDTSATAGIQGGAGNWNTTVTHWTTDGGASNIAWNNTANAADVALFTTGTGRVTLTEDISLAELRISSTNTSTIGGTGGMVYVFEGAGRLQFGAQQGVIDTIGSGLRHHSNLHCFQYRQLWLRQCYNGRHRPSGLFPEWQPADRRHPRAFFRFPRPYLSDLPFPPPSRLTANLTQSPTNSIR